MRIICPCAYSQPMRGILWTRLLRFFARKKNALLQLPIWSFLCCTWMSVGSFFYVGRFCVSHSCLFIFNIALMPCLLRECKLTRNCCWSSRTLPWWRRTGFHIACIPQISNNSVCIRVCDQGFFFFLCCIYLERVTRRFMFMISWRGSGGGGRCQNQWGEQHTRRFCLECTSFARVGAVGKTTNSYEIWTTIDTNSYEIWQEEVSNV
jgi:hypothetical protein